MNAENANAGRNHKATNISRSRNSAPRRYAAENGITQSQASAPSPFHTSAFFAIIQADAAVAPKAADEPLNCSSTYCHIKFSQSYRPHIVNKIVTTQGNTVMTVAHDPSINLRGDAPVRNHTHTI